MNLYRVSGAREYGITKILIDMTGHFFEETKEQSLVKSAIVSKYFWGWAKVIMPQVRFAGKKIAYIDLFESPCAENRLASECLDGSKR